MRELLKDVVNKVYNGDAVSIVDSILSNTKPLSGAFSLSDCIDYDFKEAGKGFKEWRDILMSKTNCIS